MPTIQVTISAEAEAILKQKIESGVYPNAGAVLEAGLGLHVESGREKSNRICRLRDELEKEISKPDFTVEEYDRYLDNVSKLDDETKMELLQFEIEEADESPDAEPGVFDRLREYIDEVAREKAKCQPTS